MKASPAGGARITISVITYMNKKGPRVVPKGQVETQNLVNGKTPCLPHSRMIRDKPNETTTRLPNALRAIRMFRPLIALLFPNTAVKKRVATVNFPCSISSLGTVHAVRFDASESDRKAYQQRNKR